MIGEQMLPHFPLESEEAPTIKAPENYNVDVEHAAGVIPASEYESVEPYVKDTFREREMTVADKELTEVMSTPQDAGATVREVVTEIDESDLLEDEPEELQEAA